MWKINDYGGEIGERGYLELSFFGFTFYKVYLIVNILKKRERIYIIRGYVI